MSAETYLAHTCELLEPHPDGGLGISQAALAQAVLTAKPAAYDEPGDLPPYEDEIRSVEGPE